MQKAEAKVSCWQCSFSGDLEPMRGKNKMGRKSDDLEHIGAPVRCHKVGTFYYFRGERSHNLYGWLQYINDFCQNSRILRNMWRKFSPCRAMGNRHNGSFPECLKEALLAGCPGDGFSHQRRKS